MDPQGSQRTGDYGVRVRLEDIDLNEEQQEDHVVEGSIQGVVPGRPLSFGPWTNDEILVLCTTYKEWWESRGPTASTRISLHETQTQKWENLSDRCYQLRCYRSPNQCQNKWDQTRVDFKKVYDYESKIPSGKPSFWTYSQKNGKKIFKLKTVMKKEVYDYICS